MVGSGFIEVTGDSVSVLTDSALGDEEIDENVTEEAIQRAEAALRDKNLSSDDTAEVEAALARSLAQIRFKRRRRGQVVISLAALGGIDVSAISGSRRPVQTRPSVEGMLTTPNRFAAREDPRPPASGALALTSHCVNRIWADAPWASSFSARLNERIKGSDFCNDSRSNLTMLVRR